MENVLLDMITEEEYKMMTNYRDWYGWNEDVGKNCKTVSIREVLNGSWARANQDLFKLLGNKLILTKEFLYEKSLCELESELRHMVDNRGEYGRSNRQGYKFVNAYYAWIRYTFPMPSTYYNEDTYCYDYYSEEDEIIAKRNGVIRDGLGNLISYFTLAENRYEGNDFSLPLKDGREYRVASGCKPMKALSKIADSYGLEGFEDFRICHSLVHNQKKLAGNISISIHPLDYWTMSDNDCGWDSCMSWQDVGGFRQGTVEMMNSPSVIVAYIDAKEPMKIGEYTWSNKKWRQLFIVDKDVILGIKSYPYYNDKLSETIINWLKELAETNMGWEYFGDADKPIKYDGDLIVHPNYMEEKPIKFDFYSNFMYTDVGCCDYHPMYVGKHIHESGEHNGCERNWCDKKVITIHYNYSGDSQCISCGVLTDNFDSECCLCCNNCQEGELRCSECGERIYDDDYSVRGYVMCEDCYNNLVRDCFVCGEPNFMHEEMYAIKVYIPVSNEFKEKLKENGYSAPEGYDLMATFSEPIDICHYHSEIFTERYLLNDGKIERYEDYRKYTPWERNGFRAISVANINLDEGDWESAMPYGFCERVEEAQKTGDYEALAEHYREYLDIEIVKDYVKPVDLW